MLYCSVQVILEPIKRIAFFSFFSWHRQFVLVPYSNFENAPPARTSSHIHQKNVQTSPREMVKVQQFWVVDLLFLLFLLLLFFLLVLAMNHLLCPLLKCFRPYMKTPWNPWNHRHVGWKSRWKIIKGTSISNADNLKIVWLILVV